MIAYSEKTFFITATNLNDRSSLNFNSDSTVTFYDRDGNTFKLFTKEGSIDPLGSNDIFAVNDAGAEPGMGYVDLSIHYTINSIDYYHSGRYNIS